MNNKVVDGCFGRNNIQNSNSSSLAVDEYIESEEDIMDDNKLLEKYMDKIDQDRRDTEKRISDSIERFENKVVQDRKESEARIEKRISEAEHRIENRFNSTMDSVEKLNDKIENTNKWIIGTCIATILAVAAIAASVWFK